MTLKICVVLSVWCAIPVWAGQSWGPMFDQYHQFQNALSQDQFEQAQLASKKLADLVDALAKKGDLGVAKALWEREGDSFTLNLKRAKQAKDIQSLRETLKPISAMVISLAEIVKPEGFQQYHCGMALKHSGGDWLQKGGTLANPYFGASMLRCGSAVKKEF